jgi:DNA-binding MarR family transcriptional regulator
VVALIAKGRKIIASAFARHESDLDEVVSVLTRDERATLVSLLRKLGTRADASLDETAS